MSLSRSPDPVDLPIAARIVDSIRALRNGKPIPEHVLRHMDEENERQMRRDA